MSDRVLIFNNITFTVCHLLKKVNILTVENEPVKIHVFGQHETNSKLEQIPYHYAGVASSVKFPKLNNCTYVNIMMFNGEKMFLFRKKIEDYLVYVHHHYGKYYVFAQTSAIITSVEIANQLYINAPIFNDEGQLISVVFDYFINDDNQCILPIPGEADGTQGSFYIDGIVCVSDSLSTSYELRQYMDVHVTYTKENVYLRVVLNGKDISRIRIKTKFAGNVLIY
jgi:Nucleopolyhedrovirus p26 protein